MEIKRKTVRFNTIGPDKILEIDEQTQQISKEDSVLREIDVFALSRTTMMNDPGYLEIPDFSSQVETQGRWGIK